MKLAILDDYQRVALELGDWSKLRDRLEITVFDRHLGGPDAVAGALAGFEVVCAMRERTPFPKALFERLPELRLLVTTGMRNAAIDLDAARAQGVTVSGTESGQRTIVEHAFALILAAARGVPRDDRRMRAGGWQGPLGFDLAGRTLGVIGLGRLGSRVAEIARVFQMQLLAWSQNLSAEAAERQGARLVSKEELLAAADIVTIHLVLSERTRGLIGRAELARMKPSAWLINTSRGPIVVEADLVDALQRRVIAGAALDVYDQEPLPAAHPLRQLDNTVLTPHAGYVSIDTYRMFFTQTAEAVSAWLDGAPIRVLT